ncbi:MAG TPA: protein kinase [Candidatus Dormibacteraeota bacterium]|nr:protein kinase [Candidatus Dormibacteraeota bacterium]
MGLTPGTKIGPYEIQSPLGAGGMGEVYRARDARLGRDVAVKVLPSHLCSDPDLKARFEREAKVISALSHPHICHLYDIGSQDGTDYLVMELLEGESLADRLKKGPVPLKQALQYGVEIAEALEVAHTHGIVHRDLKPGNVMLTKSGAKLLDFGLAKPAPSVTASSSGSMATMSKPLTVEGTILGTLQYMAPEQVQGHDADARSDLFSLGAVLYEMITGKRAFAGKSQISVMSAILEKEPEPVSAVQPLAPLALDHVIQRALAKNPDDRWQTARDLMQELKWSGDGGALSIGGVSTVAGRKTREGIAWLISVALVVILIAGSIWWRNSKPPVETMYFPAPLPFPARDIAVAPNGHTIAVVAYQESARKNVIWIYELGSHGARNLGGTEGASYPFWSADGRSLAFFADAQLKKLEVSGGPVQTIGDAPSGRGGTWNKDGVIVFAPSVTAGLYRVPASGGTPTKISDIDKSLGQSGLRWPVFLPDGKHFLYLAANFTGQKGGNIIYVGALDSKEKHFVVESTANAAYAAPGYLLFYRDKTLYAQPFDLKRFALTGEATVILPDVQFLPQVKRAVFAVSDQGLLLAQSGSEAALSQLTWFDRKGNTVGAVGKPEVYGNVFLAPNGRSVAIDKTDMSSLNIDVWTYELQSYSAKRLTFDPGIDSVPVWSPDAARLVFSSNRQIYFGLYLKNSDGATDEKGIVQEDEIGSFPSDWSRDGKYILYCRGSDLGLLTYPELKSSIFLKAPSVLRNGQFSPDGKWVAYASNESGKWEIYVTSFPDARGKWQISSGGGEQPRWRGDGKELFYLSLDGKMMAAPVTTGAHFDAGTPVALFQSTPRQPVLVYDLFVYDVSRDGERFLINTQVKQGESAPMSVVLNWTAKLEK